MSIADGSDEHKARGRTMFDRVIDDLTELERDDLLTTRLWFTLTGVTPALLRYNLLGTHSLHVCPVPSLLPSLEALGLAGFDTASTAGHWPRRAPLVFDLGIGGGLDAAALLLRGVNLLGADALPS